MNLRRRSYLVENDQERVRASKVSENERLPNLHKVMPYKRYQKIGYRGQAEVDVFRTAGSTEDRNIRAGQTVVMKREYLADKVLEGRTKILKRRVRAMDLVWTGMDGYWVYDPITKQPELKMNLNEAVLSDIEGVDRIIDTRKLRPEDDHALGFAAYVQGNSLVGWHVADSIKTVREIIRKKGSLQAGYGPRGQHAELGPGLYISAAPQLWTGRATGKWEFTKTLSARDSKKLLNQLEKDVLAKEEKGLISKPEREYAIRDINHVRNDRLTWDALVRLAGLPYSIPFWKESYLEKLGVKGSPAPKMFEITVKGKFAKMSGPRPNKRVLRLLRKGGVDGAFTPSSFAAEPQLIVWNPRAVVKIGKGEEIR